MADGYTPDPADELLVMDAFVAIDCAAHGWASPCAMHVAEVVLSALAAAGRLNDGQAEARGYARAPVVPPVTPDPDLPATPDAALTADGRAALTQDLQRMARDRRLAADADLTRHRPPAEHREDGTQP